MAASDKRQTHFVFRYALQSFGLVVLVAILIRTFLVSSYVMAGAAMLPSIWPGDFLFAYKLKSEEPRRGEVLVLRCPSPKERICLKRVVGLPGDRIEFDRGQLQVNAQPARGKKLGDEFVQETVEGTSWAVWPTEAETTTRPLVVPPSHVYVLNDKRDDGEDSRQWGPLPLTLVEGRAGRVWLSLDWYERTGEVRPWPRVRWDRLFRAIN